MRLIPIGAALALPLALVRAPASGQAADPKPELVATTEARTPEEERAGFHLPPGFAIELVAAEPQIDKPLNIAFDDRGRLWVTSTVEYPFPVTDESVTPRDRVVVLDQFGENGRAGRARTFADGLNIPIGLLPMPGGSEALVAHSIPNILRLTDADGDGRADRREVAYGVFGSADTHGMTNAFLPGFDGWIYACHGFSNTSEVRGSDGEPIAMQSGNTYRFRPDGSHAEYHTHGQVNPFGLCWDPLGNLYSADCHSKPVYQLLRGAYYPSFGKPDDGLGFGPPMVKHDHGSTGIAGVVYYAADHFPEPYRDTVFIGNVVTSRVNHDRIDLQGSTPIGVLQPDFLSSDDPWFRPVDFELGPDGALYIADFYNRIIGHYEVPLTHPGRDRERGRIWRVVYRGPDGQGRPEAPRVDFADAPVEDLAADLGHPNLVVRLKAADQLATRPDNGATARALDAVDDRESPLRRAHALWVLQRRGALDEARLGRLAGDPEPLVRVHALRVVGERPDLTSRMRPLAIEGLADPDAHIRRASAEALGRHPDPAFVRPLLDLRLDVPEEDTHLLHVVRMALRDQLLDAGAWARLPVDLDDRDFRAIADVATGVPLAEAARFLLDHLLGTRRRRGDRIRDIRHIARHGDESAVVPLLAFARGDEPDNLDHQAALLRALAQGNQERGRSLDDPSRAWALDLTRRLIDSDRDETARSGFDLAGTIKLDELRDRVVEVALDRAASEPRRGAAIDALVVLDPPGSVGPLAGVVADASDRLPIRVRAVGGLARVNRPEGLEAMAEALPTAPGSLQIALAAALARGGRDGAERLLEAVESGRASARILQNRLVEILLQNAGVPDLTNHLEPLTAGLPPAEAGLQALLDRRRDGFDASKADPARGASVFETTCAACHQLGGRGARIGPQLDGIGIRGIDRLLEDILDPNRNVDQQFRATTVALDDGRVVSGLLLNEEGNVLVFADTEGREVRVAAEEVEDRKTDPLSPMPANFAEAIPEAELVDLLAYLLAQRPPLGIDTEPASGPGSDRPE